jgi:hypothetical protein
MKSTKILAIMVLALGLMILTAEAAPMGTAFTFQGRLMDANETADGLYNFQFKLYDDANTVTGNQVGSDLNVVDVDVIEGFFTVALDFNDPNAFNGDARWLEIDARPGDSNDVNDFVTLSPRQEVTPTPYALQTRGIFVDDSGNVNVDRSMVVREGIEVGTGTIQIGVNANRIRFTSPLGPFFGRIETAPGSDMPLIINAGATGDIQLNPTSMGNVGIGTNDPGAKLEVVQNAGVRAMRIDKTGIGGGLYIDNDGVGYGLRVRQNGHVSGILLEQTGNAHAMSIDKRGEGGGDCLTIGNYGIGYGIFINQYGEREGLYIDQNANANAQVIGNYGTASGLYIWQAGVLGFGDAALNVGTSTEQTNAHLVKFGQSNGSSTADILWLDNSGTGRDIYETEHGASLDDGHWVNGCSIVNKENLEEVNRTNILSKVEELRIRQFNMKGSTDKHISATAEDFHVIFGLGDDKGISAGDVASIALICIKELKAENEALRERVQDLEESMQKWQFSKMKEVQK